MRPGRPLSYYIGIAICACLVAALAGAAASAPAKERVRDRGFLSRILPWGERVKEPPVPKTPEPAPPSRPTEEPTQDELGFTLWDCYQLSLIQSETIGIKDEFIEQTQAHFLEALSIVLPHVSFISTDFQTEEPPPSSSGVGASSITRTKSSERQITVKQTLFNGFKAIAALEGSGFEKKQRTYDKQRAEQLLFVDVANAFYLVSELRADLRALEKTRYALEERIKELKERELLGRSRRSEVVNARVQLYTVLADIERNKAAEAIAGHLLEFLTGRRVKVIRDTFDVPQSIENEDYYVSGSIDRPDIESAYYSWRVSKEAVRVTGSDFLPNASLQADYYLQRTGFDKGIDWDVMLVVNAPIFEGTEILGRVQEAESQARINALDLRQLRRSAPIEVRDAYTSLVTARRNESILKKAFRASMLNYHLQKQDYRMNLVSNLDVLTALQNLKDNERTYVHAKYETKRLYWQLLVAAGETVTGGI